jgi:hypothetical protein
MTNIKPESKSLENVRRWRRETYEELRSLSPAQRAEQEKQLAAHFGLTVVDSSQLVKPGDLAPRRKTG